MIHLGVYIPNLFQSLLSHIVKGVHDDVDDEDTSTIAKKLRNLVNAHADTDISHLSQFFVIFKDSLHFSHIKQSGLQPIENKIE